MITRKRTMAAIAAMVMAFANLTLTAEPLTANAEAFTKSHFNTVNDVSFIPSPSYDPANTSWTGSYVYYGKYEGEPVKYRVLVPKRTEADVMWLDCDTVLYYDWLSYSETLTFEFDERLDDELFRNKDGVFTSIEKNAIYNSIYRLWGSTVTNPLYGYGSNLLISDPTRIKKNFGEESAGNWWTSEEDDDPFSVVEYGTWFIGEDGAGDVARYDSYKGASPSFHVKHSSILFASQINDTTASYGREYKLTLKNPAFGISVKNDSSVAPDGKTIMVPYTVTDLDEELDPDTVSVLIQNKSDDRILYYAPLSGTYAASGTGTFKLPDSLSIDDWGKDYTVSFLAEDVNGQYETDYASEPEVLNAPIALDTKLVTNKTYKQTANKNGKYYTRFVFVKPKSEIQGKSKAIFTAHYDGKDYTYETSSYYTGVISDGITYTADSADSVLFVVTVSSGSDISSGLTCDIALN